MSEKRTHKFTINFEPEFYKKLAKAAREEERTVGAYIRRIIKLYLCSRKD